MNLLSEEKSSSIKLQIVTQSHQGLTSRKDGTSWCPTISHLFQVVKKKLNFFAELCGPQRKFSSRKDWHNGAQLHQNYKKSTKVVDFL
jgi:hypothetical protein